jgi:hypothetical protein
MKMNWADLDVGDRVRGRDKYTWVLMEKTDAGPGKHKVTLQREGAAPFSTEVSGEVEVVWTAAMEAAKAEALIQVQLGGETIGRKSPGGVHLTPVHFTEPGSLLAHAYIFHARVGDGSAALAELTRWHDELHANPNGMTDHHHDPDFYKVNR